MVTKIGFSSMTTIIPALQQTSPKSGQPIGERVADFFRKKFPECSASTCQTKWEAKHGTDTPMDAKFFKKCIAECQERNRELNLCGF